MIVSDLRELHEIGLDNLKIARVLVERRSFSNFGELQGLKVWDRKMQY